MLGNESNNMVMPVAPTGFGGNGFGGNNGMLSNQLFNTEGRDPIEWEDCL